MLLRNHGTLAVGKNVGECFVRLYFLERACQAQIMALSAGDAISNPPQGAPELTAQQGAVGLEARRQPARLAGAQAQGLPPRPELRDLSWRGKAASVGDYRALAKARLPHFLFEYLDGGSYDEVTLRRNVEDLQAIALKQRVLRDVSSIDLSTELFGKRWAMPVGLGPVGLSGLYARRGEVQAARAAAAAGVPFALSTRQRLLDRRSRGGGPVLWFQLYIVKDRGFVSGHDRAGESGGLRRADADRRPAGARLALSRYARAWRRRCAAACRRRCWRRPDWAWDVGVRGRPMSLGNLEPIVGSGARRSTDFMGWIARQFRRQRHLEGCRVGARAMGRAR